MEANEAGPDSFKNTVVEKSVFFYADDELITFTNPARLY